MAGVVALVIAGGAAYGVLTFHQAGGFDTATGPCAGTGVIVDRVKPKIGGEVAAMVPASGPLSLSQLQFQKADGSKTTLADWSGKTILLNLWATWCAPCRAEMPALDKLQAALGSKDFEVVTVNVDSASAGDKPHKFLSEVGVKSLSFQSDPTLGVVKALKKVSRSRGSDDDADRRQGLRDRHHVWTGAMGFARRAKADRSGHGTRVTGGMETIRTTARCRKCSIFQMFVIVQFL